MSSLCCAFVPPADHSIAESWYPHPPSPMLPIPHQHFKCLTHSDFRELWCRQQRACKARNGYKTTEQISFSTHAPQYCKTKGSSVEGWESFVSDLHGTILEDAQFSKLSQLSLQGQMKWIHANHSVNCNSKFPCTSWLAPPSSHCVLGLVVRSCVWVPWAGPASLSSMATSMSQKLSQSVPIT